MKEIKAIIRSSKFWDVTVELQKIEELPGVTVSEIKGFGKSRAKNAKDKIVYEIVNVIQKAGHSGVSGDGKIFVVNVEEVVKIRTNERGENAI